MASREKPTVRKTLTVATRYDKSRLALDFRGARVYITCWAKTENGNCGANFSADTLGLVSRHRRK